MKACTRVLSQKLCYLYGICLFSTFCFDNIDVMRLTFCRTGGDESSHSESCVNVKNLLGYINNIVNVRFITGVVHVM